MLQVIQYQKTGEISVEELPKPQLKNGGVVVKNVFSLISAGTERTSVGTAQASILEKAKLRPDLVKQVIDNVKREGLVATYEKVKNRLDNYKELGYSSAGIVTESSVEEFKIGDQVACAGFAHHAEFISVPKNLVAKIPDNVSFENAAFTTLGAIAIQGVRQSGIGIGDSVAVIGLGLVGLITIQLLKATGCKVVGLDISDSNFQLAKNFGCNECELINVESVKRVWEFSNYNGVDAALITASTKSNDPFEKAVEFVRKKGTVVVVGVVGMQIPYRPAYDKEIEIKMSCSYGPGRYDTDYEERGIDYPVGYVKWTENRNMQAVIGLLSEGKLDFNQLITHQFYINEALKAYDLITNKVKDKYVGILIRYPTHVNSDQIVFTKFINKKYKPVIGGKETTNLNIAFIGAGNFAQSYLLPNLGKLGVNLKTIVTSKPANAKSVSEKFNFENFSTSPIEAIADPAIGSVFIATRHDSHGKFVIESLKHNKNIFVEKPLCRDINELIEILNLYKINLDAGNSKFISVGYNRRFSKPIRFIKNFFGTEKEPLYFNYRISAGYVPKADWYQAPEQGGRVIGEACHFVDTLIFLCGSKPVSVFASTVLDNAGKYSNDNINIVVHFHNGSVGNIAYLANGSKQMDKEYLEVSGGGKSAKMFNFKLVELLDSRKIVKKKFPGGKGHAEEMNEVVDALKNGKLSVIPFEELILTTLTTIKVLESVEEGNVKRIEL